MMPELSDLYRQSVTVEPYSSVDSYNVASYGAAVSHRVRVSGKRRLVRNDAGDEVISTHQVYFYLSPAIGAHDRITLSTGDVNSTEAGARQPKILAVGKYPDDVGRTHLTVFLA